MKKAKTPGLVTTAIITTITIFTWIVFSVYQAFTEVPLVNVPPEVLAPLSPDLDREALSKLESRLYFEEGQAGSILIPVAPEEELSPTPTLSPTPSATESGTPTTTPTP